MNHRSLSSLAACALALALSAPAAAAPGLTELANTPASSWATTRAAALADNALMQTVHDTQGTLSFQTQWTEGAMVEILAAAEGAPDEAARVTQLRGIDPAWYLKARRPIPLVTRELTRMNLSAGALLEAWMFHRSFPLKRSPAAYPEAKRAELDALRRAEALALEEGILTALARTQHPAGVSLLIEQLETGDSRRQGLAAVLLGETRQPAAEQRLHQLLADETVRGGLRGAALVGVGKLRSLPAVQLLVAESARTDRSSEERRAVIGALANVGNHFAHEAQPQPQSDAIRKQASDALLAMLPKVASNTSLANVLAQAIANVGHPSATDALSTLSTSSDEAIKRTATLAQTLHARTHARR